MNRAIIYEHMGDDEYKKKSYSKKRRRKKDDSGFWDTKLGILQLFSDHLTAFTKESILQSWLRLSALGIVNFTAISLCAVLGAFKLLTAPIAVTVIVMAMLASVGIWTLGRNKQNIPPELQKVAEQELQSLESLQAKIDLLEERLANVEVIESFEDRLAAKELAMSTKPESDKEHSSATTTHSTMGPSVSE